LIKGSVPGAEGDYVIIREAKKYPVAQARADREKALKEKSDREKALAKAKADADAKPKAKK
jgi:hypothetical protein